MLSADSQLVPPATTTIAPACDSRANVVAVAAIAASERMTRRLRHHER